MEILENYPYMLHGLSQQHVPNQTPNDDASATSDIIKTEPFDASDDVVVNVNGNGDTGTGSASDVNSGEKTNDQTTENSQPDAPSNPESNGGAGASDASSNGAKRRKCSVADATATSSEENGDGKGVNDDYHFLMSMQPFMSELSLAQKLRLRMKIQKLVFDELYGCYNDLRT